MQIYKNKKLLTNDLIDYLIEVIKASKSVLNKTKLINFLNVIHDMLSINLLNEKTDKKTFDSKISEVNKLIIKNSNKDNVDFDNKKIKYFNDTAGCDFVIESLNI